MRKSNKSPHKQLQDKCDALWAECIKARAGYRSEYSGKSREHGLHSHHINGKSNFRLRYELDNGVSLTPGEHKFIAHHQGRMEEFREFIKALRGSDIFERLQKLRWDLCKTSLYDVKPYLEQKLREFKDALSEL